MALIVFTLQDTEEGIEFKLSSEPGFPAEDDAELTIAQTLALLALRAITEATNPPDEEEEQS